MQLYPSSAPISLSKPQAAPIALNKTATLKSLQQGPIALNKKADIDMKKIDATAKDFEAMFVGEMMQPMFDTIEVDKNFGGGKGEEVYKSLMVQEYGKAIAETGQLGIADMVKQQMIDLQERANNPEMAQNLHGKNTSETGDM